MDANEQVKAEVDKTNLQKNLLTAVKECQKKYGGQVELATELDFLVAHVCHCFESVFSHGLKKQLPKQSWKLVDVKFVEKPTFWHCVTNILSHHERDRYNSLYKVKSNLGKGRAWLRSALNERSLERYLNTLICNEDLLTNYYEPEAFLRDQEKSYILPTAAAGLNPILFAISIDREDLNRKFCDIYDTFSKEQIIATAPVGVMKVNNLRKKLQSKVIEFDEDPVDNGNYDEINASVSTTSDISSIIEMAEEASEIVINDNTSLSSESEDKVSTGLRPIGDQAVDELIPVLTDITEVDETALFPDCPSEDGISIDSSDDVNFQKLYELGKEQLKKQISSNVKFEARVQELNRENEVLKHQLRKYVSAVQMLKRDDADHTYEAQLYENKLVQVAEMHGELMELNRRLQISLLAKEEVIKRLQEELVSLRGPLPSDNFSLHKLVSLWVPSVFLTGRYSDPHHVYQVHFRIGSEEWNIYRRYSQFHSFHQKLKKEYSSASEFHFPPKKTIGNKDANFVEERRKKLQMYLRQVINFILTQDATLATSPTKALFTTKVRFFGEQYKEGSQSRPQSIFSNCLTQNELTNEDFSSPQYTGL